MTLAASAEGGADVVAALDATVARARGSALDRERLARMRVRTLEDMRVVLVTTRPCKFSLSMCHGLAGVLVENAPSAS